MIKPVNICKFGNLCQNKTDIMQTTAENKLNRLKYYLPPEAKKRLKWMYAIKYESNNNISLAANKIGISRTWLSQIHGKWKNNYEDPRSLEPRSKAPRNTPKKNRQKSGRQNY